MWGASDDHQTQEAIARETDWPRSFRVQGGVPKDELPEGGITIGDLARRYLAAIEAEEAGRERSTPVEWAKVVVKLLSARFDDLTAASFGPLRLRTLRSAMIETARWCRRSLNENVRRIVQVFEWGVSLELVPEGVHAALKTVKPLQYGRSSARESTPVLPVPLSVVEKTPPLLPTLLASVARLMLHCGARPGELLGLRPQDIDRSGEVWIATILEHKTASRGRSRFLYFGPRSQELLRPYLLRAGDSDCFSPQESVAELRSKRHAARKTPNGTGNSPGTNRKRQPASKPGLRYSTNAFARAIRRACDRGGIERWHPHMVRHLFATTMRERFDFERVGILLGHADPDATSIYIEKDERNRRLGIAAALEVG